MGLGREQEVVRHFAAGEVIIHEGDDGREMFVIQRGGVSVSICRDGETLHLADLERGDFFGEMSLLESLPRSATVTARADTDVLVINPGTLLLRIRRDPTFAFELLNRMSQKLRAINDKLVAIRLEDGALDSRGADDLLRMAGAELPAGKSRSESSS